MAAGAKQVRPVPVLSDDEFQQKLKDRWDSMLTAHAAATPADLTEMQLSGRFTPDPLKNVQLESSLRTLYNQQAGRSLGQQAWDATKSGAEAVGGRVADASMIPALYEVAKQPGGFWHDLGRLAASGYEGASDAVSGLARFGGRVLQEAGNKLATAYDYYTGQPANPNQTEQDYQA